jgi:hypothetical protein
VQNSRKTDAGSESLPVESTVEQSVRRTLKEHRVHEGLVVENQRVEFVGKGDDDVEIVSGEESFESLLHPSDLLQSLTFGTMAVAARIVRDVEVAAIVFTDIHVPAQSGGATLFDVAHDLKMFIGKRVSIPVVLAMGTEDIGNFQLSTMVVRGLLGR